VFEFERRCFVSAPHFKEKSVDRKERIKELLDQAAKIRPGEREAFLSRECNGDDAMKREIEELLAADENSPHLTEPVAFRVGNEDETLGKVLGGRYSIKKKLGKGGMGEVYLAEDTEIPNRKVAIKIFEQGFAKEVEALARIKSENVVRIITTGKTEDGRPFMVMEYLTGQTLTQLLAKGDRLPHLEIAQLMQILCEAVTELHETKTEHGEEGIIHRDLKPSNIMVERHKKGWRIKLFDLGVARLPKPLMSKSTIGHVPQGTPLYMAPEQFYGEAMASFGCQRRSPKEIVSPQTDIYSLGVIAYEMLTGQHPFHDALSFHDVATKQLEKKYEEVLHRHHEIPVAAREVVLKAMAFCPEQRQQKAEEIGEQLAHALITAPVPPEPPRAKYWMTAALVLLLLLGGGLLTWYLLGGSNVAEGNRAATNSDGNSTRAGSPGMAGGNGNMGHSVPEAGTNSPAPASELELAYWMITQPKGNEHPVGEPKIITAQDRFINGSHVKIYVESKSHGHLYLINDGPSARGSTLQILFPVPQRNDGQSKIAPNQQVEAFSGDVGKSNGTEHLWIIWSAEKEPLLEGLSKYTNDTYKGKVSDPGDIEATRSFLAKFKQADAEDDPQNQRVILRSRGGTVVKELLLKHF
jgi:serine/threonine protein kinase